MSAFYGEVSTEIPVQDHRPGERSWLTAQEFRAAIEAHRAARLKERQNQSKATDPRVVARVYQLNPHLKYQPRPKVAPSPEAAL